MPQKPTKKRKPAPKYKLEVRVNGAILKATGDDLKQMLLDLDFPRFVKCETNVIVSTKDKTIQKDLKVFQARRAFTGLDNTPLQLLGISLTKQLG